MGVRAAKKVFVVAAVLAVGASCASGDEGQGVDAAGPPVVVATTSIWADVVANVACDGLAQVETLIPVGTDAHSFEPSLADRQLIDEAGLVVANGLGLEESLEDTLEQAEADGTPVFEVGDHVDTLDRGDEADDHGDSEALADEDGGEQGHGGSVDPHVWFDPIRVSDALDPLAETLVADVGLDQAGVEACVVEYREELAATDGQIQEELADIAEENRVLVTNHESLGYFADRYGFAVLGTVIPSTSTLAESNPADIAELAATIDEAGVQTVFGETSLSGDDLRALAREAGAQVVALYTESLGEPESGADTYVGFLVTDAELISGGLAGEG